MRKLKLLIPILLVLSILFVACGETANTEGENNNNSENNAPTYNTVSLSDAKADFAGSGDIFASYTLKLTVRSVKDEDEGSLSVFDESGNGYLGMLYMSGSNGSRINFPDFPEAVDEGDIIIVKGNLKEDESGKVIVWRAELLFLEKAELEADTILKIRDFEDGTEVIASGTVAAIAYSGGSSLEPCGVILVDSTSSIYVYDKAIAKSVKVGNTITVEGTIGHWVLDNEKANAEKFGYSGSCQIENAALVDNDGKTTDFDKSWIEEISVKELLEIPVTENVTTKLYKVNALVREVQGGGFVNYYFFDIDGETGTYAYTQCNGKDFSWVGEFDGKFCTVYITPLNAKSTDSDCYFRFLPVQVIDEGYKFDTADAPEYAVKYHGITQLKGSYTGDPALNLISEVSSELLGFEGVSISYLSSDESIIKFTKTADGYIMNCPGFGKATVTVVATYGTSEYSETIEIVIEEPAEMPSITPEQAILAAEGEEITVKGIVGPSFVHTNRRGFYIIGEDGGVIAVSFANVDDLKDIAIGNTVFIKGTRAYIKDNTDKEINRHVMIDEAALLANLYGEAQIPENAITEGASLSDIKATENTTAIFRVSATVKYQEINQFVKNYYADGETLYSSDALSQYSFLSPFDGQKVTLLVSVTNWNGKQYKITAVGVEADGKTIYNEYSFTAAKK